MDRRKEPRRKASVPVEVEQTFAGRRGYGIARDIGPGGLFLETPDPFVVGDFVRLRFHLPSSSAFLEVEGQVVRVQEGDPHLALPSGVGIRFVDAPEWVVAEVRRFVVEGLNKG